MYFKYYSDDRQYMRIIDASQICTIKCNKTFEDKYTSIKNVKTSEWTEEYGYVILTFKNHSEEFIFSSHKNIDEFIEQLEQCLNTRDQSIFEIKINHERPKKPKIITSNNRIISNDPILE